MLMLVSIHAPARGATRRYLCLTCSAPVSIHAPARGATITAQLWGQVSAFQSTHPHGVRHQDETFRHRVRVVSIHAPARGATFHILTLQMFLLFQSTHPHGVRLTACRAVSVAIMFQSTHPHGVRRRQHQGVDGLRCFNPRTRTGCDS